jgi:hypothetical protein
LQFLLSPLTCAIHDSHHRSANWIEQTHSNFVMFAQNTPHGLIDQTSRKLQQFVEKKNKEKKIKKKISGIHVHRFNVRIKRSAASL